MKGQVSLEGLIVLVFFIAVLCLGIGLMKEKLVLGGESLSLLNAKSNALACGILVNGFYSNSAEEIGEFGVNCFFEEKGRIEGEFEGEKRSAFCLAEGEFLSQGNGKRLVVEKLKHYG